MQYHKLIGMPKSKKKMNSDGKLARMIQREFTHVHRRLDEIVQTMATKQELELLRKDMEAGFLGIIHTLKTMQKEIEELKGMDAELTSMRLRLARVERKVGLAR